MPNSKISICNLALASLGEDSIRSFDEDNKRARMCDGFYEQAKDYLLSKFDWPFARKLKELKEVVLPDEEIPDGEYAYQLPADCKTPRDLYPAGSRDYWRIAGRVMFCRKSPEDDIRLYYTQAVTDVTQFSDSFATLLYLLIAVRMSPAITQDKSLTQALSQQYQVEMREAWESDANIGNDYKPYDGDANNDTFVNPDESTQHYEWWKN